MGLHQLTGNSVWDAAGSIVIGILLGFVAVFLIKRNRQFLVDESLAPGFVTKVLTTLLAHPRSSG